MLHEFIAANRPRLIDRCRALAARRPTHQAASFKLESGVPLFVDQLITTLRLEQSDDTRGSHDVSGSAGGETADLSEIGVAAKMYGRQLSQQGFTVDQVVHNYGDVCQAISALAVETGSPIAAEEFMTLNRCLDNAIAGAVTEFAHHHAASASDQSAQASNERLGFLAHQLRDQLHTATLAMTAIKAGAVGVNSATGALLERSLVGLGSLIDRSLADVRITAGMPVRHQIVPLTRLFAEMRVSGSLEARVHGCTLVVGEIKDGLEVEVDRDMLYSAVGNLLQNAFKFTRQCSEVSLTARASGDRVLIEVSDHCGGLAPGVQERMFLPFTQSSPDKSGVGLGLPISKRCVEANGGLLSVRNVPGSGCVFTIELPRTARATAVT